MSVNRYESSDQIVGTGWRQIAADYDASYRRAAPRRLPISYDSRSSRLLSAHSLLVSVAINYDPRTRHEHEHEPASLNKLAVNNPVQWQHCLHLQLYRDPKDRFKKGQTKASLSLQHFLGFESGFTLDKESNTIAIICQDVIVVLAFETRERLISWQVKVGGQLGSSKEFLVIIGGGGSRKLLAGPARLHLQGRKFALTSGVPPRILGLWELAHLRRYGVVEGRFCFEGGSHCGKGEGLHMLITDQAQDITDAFDQAAQRNITPRTPRGQDRDSKSRPSTRLSDFNTLEHSLQDGGSALYEENYFGEDCSEASAFWPSSEKREFENCENRPDTDMGAKPPWSGADHITLERCSNCLTKLGSVSRCSTVALRPEANFNPAWTMEAVHESGSEKSSNSSEYSTTNLMKNHPSSCDCKDQPPKRPPKPQHLEQKLQNTCVPLSTKETNPKINPKVGPYENYDVPKMSYAKDSEIENSEYYDTPKRIKKALAEDLFRVTKTSSPDSLVLKKNCGCILKFGSKKKPLIVESDESLPSADCPCQKVTNWANNLISLPYCRKSTKEENNDDVLLNSNQINDTAIYATVDISRKINRRMTATQPENDSEDSNEPISTNYQNLGPKEEKDFEGPYANYENLEFALSLEYYENAKDLLKKAGVTQSELDALSSNLDLTGTALPIKPRLCLKCGHCKSMTHENKNKSDEYLLMEPPSEVTSVMVKKTLGNNPGYTPMSPNPNWSQSLRHPITKLNRTEIEKSFSIPTLNRNKSYDVAHEVSKETIQKRSCSVDSARLLEDLKEFDSSIGSHATSSSLETLRNLVLENRLSMNCDKDRECYECCKSSGSDNKTSEESPSKEMPHLRNKHMDNAAIKRSSSVPCKGGNRDSSSSNDSGVSSCSLKHGGEFQEYEMPLTSMHSRYHYIVQKRLRGNLSGSIHSSLPRKSKSSDPLRDQPMQIHKNNASGKSSSAEAEVPILPPKQFKGVLDTHSTSSGTSDMSDYIETLSLTSSHSSSDNPSGMRINRQPTNTLRPRSGKEYHNLDPILTSMYKNGKDLNNYTNLP
ncbi:unnamed protein product [Danaus chrysippus]|uniref:(African queen) hypothetical protein n=1 Tax=Danaus chrysippus TaxID=151541 RepID=A0A8J2VZJ2_9NEOP|nr:unnamed protein product [Danaus chrysippus]